MSAIPADLVPLSEIASQLRLTTRTLVEKSALKEFPPVHRVSDRGWRVSQSAVEDWFSSRDALSELRREEDHRRRVSAAVRARDPGIWAP